MSGIDNFLNNKHKQDNYFISTPQADNKAVQTAHAAKEPKVQTSSVRDEFVKIKKNNGLVGKFYNFLKNKTNFGSGTKAVEKEIDKFEKGEIKEEKVREKISQYKISQENAVQSTGDIATGAVTISSYFLANNYIKKLRAQLELDALPEIIKDIKKYPESKRYKRYIQAENIIKSKSKTMLVMLPILAVAGGITKLIYGKAERIGSKEFKVDKKAFADKKEYKAEKKKAGKARRKANWKNFATGALNGMLAPLTALAGGIAGVPAYLLATTGLRYASSKNDGKEKSLNDFTKSLKDNAAVNTVTAAAIALPSIKKAHFSHVFDTNLGKVVDKLKGQQLQLPDLPSSKSAYQELEDLMLSSESIKKILKPEEYIEGRSLETDITNLTDENIFAVKFLQIKNSGFLSGYNPYHEISEALRESCPPTRTIEQAQQHINKMWGSNDYTVSKLLGVGTIAETYLAKDKSGKEVCIKVLKEGINADKIAKDKEKFIKLITGDTPQDKLTDNQKYLIRNINDLAEGISKEVDFVNEMNAAKELKKYTKTADVVVPMEAKQGIYVMEKAPGISVKTLVDYYECERHIKWARKMVKKYPDDIWYQEEIQRLEEKMQKIKSRSPEFAAFDMTPSQIKRLLKNYIDLQVEQFSKVDKNGKVVHADIHPGNIFINLEALKSGKGKLFTLIDTGNTIKLSKEQSVASLKVVGFIKNGNTKDLTSVVLEDAILPQAMTKEKAAELVENDFKKYFFDKETKIESMNMDTFYVLSENILRKHNIISNNTQLNLNKAKISARNSFNDLFNSFFEKKYGDKDWSTTNKAEMATAITRAMADGAEIGLKMTSAQTVQESKNLFQMSWKEAMNFLRNKNMLKTNSEEYLTYKLKQNMPGPKIDVNVEELIR